MNRSSHGFFLGFANALLLVAGLILMAQTVTWLTIQPHGIAGYVALMTVPRFSLLDLVEAVGALMTIFAIGVTTRYFGGRL
ncbi:hypothetical protein GCM10009066_17530 [Halarchaeum salinum]|uniref:Uncharacterized protein n=1 Tax=Halarchaeum salinum TaxID=489912 RepID=A0AAV3S896_9EURY